MRGSKQAPGVHEPKDMKMWGCKDIDKHPEYMNLSIWGCEDARISTSTQSTWIKDMRMWGFEDTRKHTTHTNIRI